MKGLVLVALCLLLALVVGEPSTATKYKCGSECNESLMGSDDPNADSMPHDFGPHIPLSKTGLSNTMNAYLKDEPNHKAPTFAVPAPRAAMPDLHEAGEFQTVPQGDQIPYAQVPDGPALRRPCNLDEIMALLNSIKDDYVAEDKHDTQLHADGKAMTAAVASAKLSLDDANGRVRDIEKAKEANATLALVAQAITIKTATLQDLMEQKSMLVKEEGMLKAPIVKAIGRTNVNLQAAMDAKQEALNDFAQHPAMSNEETQQVLTTYNELIISVKNQLTGLRKEASDVLTPVQLNINQTEHSISRVQAELSDLRKQQERLIPIAEKYTEDALMGAKAIAADVLAHYNAQSEAEELAVANFDKRNEDRRDIIKLTEQLLMLVGDIQQPQDPTDKHVVADSRVPISLAGSIPKVPMPQPIQN